MPEDLFRLIAVAGYTAYRNSQVGRPAPSVAAYHERVTHPEVGDLVLETSTFTKSAWPASSLGWLRAAGVEPVQSEEEHDQMLSEGDHWDHENEGHEWIPTEMAYYVVSLDPDAVEPETRWTNANFISLPVNYETGELLFNSPREEQRT